MKFKIQNFGPITQGYSTDDGFLHIDGVTVFIGGQGTGKSSVAKCLSTVMWLEKALLRRDFSPEQLMSHGAFKFHFTYHGIVDYFEKDTVLDYQGRYYRLSYAQEHLTIEPSTEALEIDQPKIMYVPSERNFLSSQATPSLMAKLHPSLTTFLDEFENAKHAISGPVSLPVDHSSYSNDQLNDISWVERRGNKTRLTNASSGYQSLIPLFLVTDYLANFIDNADIPLPVHHLRSMRQMLNEATDPAQQQQIPKRFKPSYTINVVEEPEQNLFPDSQVKMMYSLLGYQNRNALNQLIITTHSPYILNAATLAVACFITSEKNQGSRSALADIVPSHAWLRPDRLTVYEIDEAGVIQKLESCYDLPSDENYLNNFLGSFNDNLSAILELEESR